jgi:YggT family protein
VFFWRLVSALLVFYIILLTMRLLLSWFSAAAPTASTASGRYWQLLVRVTDPWLGAFRGMGFLRRGQFDFTGVAAILVLIVALDLVNAAVRHGRFTLGLALAAAVGAVWSGLSFLILLFSVLAALRLILCLAARRYESPLGQLLEAMLRPVVSFARGLLPRSAAPKQTHLLLFVIAALLAVQLLGALVFRAIRVSLASLPF